MTAFATLDMKLSALGRMTVEMTLVKIATMVFVKNVDTTCHVEHSMLVMIVSFSALLAQTPRTVPHAHFACRNHDMWKILSNYTGTSGFIRRGKGN